MEGRRVPPHAWVLSGGTALALMALTVPALLAHGQSWFFRDGDAYMFRATARDLFGHGHAFAAVDRLAEVPYRYGRVGLPFLGWLLAAGRPAEVAWPLIVVHLGSIAAIPGLAATLLDDYRAPALSGAVVFLAPGFLVIHDNVFSEPLLIALVLLAYILDSRGRRTPALCVIAFAVLVKEVAALALIPWLWPAVRSRDWRRVGAIASTLVPYAAWCAWLKFRVGEFPFLAHTVSRSGALGLPGVGIHRTFLARTPGHGVIVSMALVTIALGLAGAWLARPWSLAGLAATFAVLTACLGPNALRYQGEVLRVLAVPQVFALLCLVVGFSRGLSAPDADL